MRKIRKVYLQNTAGNRFGLNGENGVYASSLAGFGFSLEPVFVDLTRGFFASVNEEYEPQNTLSFMLTFTRNPYESYESFVNWVSSAGKITVVYNPTQKQEYCREVTIQSLQKGELSAVGWLELACSFYCNTPWYLPTPFTLTMDANGLDESKRYDYVYDDALMYGIDSSAALTGEIRGTGHIPGAVEISCRGAIVNPRIRLVGNISGKTFGLCSIATTLLASDTLKYSSCYEGSYVKKVSAEGIETDLLDVLDLGSTPFFHVPVNEPCTITIEADNAFSGFVDMTIFYYFRSV